MRVIIQRAKESNVIVDNKVIGSIDHGMVILVGFTEGDSLKDIEVIINKLIHLRVFDDESGVMNKSLIDVKGSILSISQFTLYANTSKGRRPSYVEALNPIEAEKLYDEFNNLIRKENIIVETGIFGADMELNIKNDGPVTITLES